MENQNRVYFLNEARLFFHNNGMRVTSTRLQILGELLDLDATTFKANELYLRLHHKNLMISPSAINNTLKELCKYGLLCRLVSDEGVRFFEKTDKFIIMKTPDEVAG